MSGSGNKDRPDYTTAILVVIALAVLLVTWLMSTHYRR